jgi:NADP-dependent 3-hydroxy acid dehydrogenase YdfG
MLITGASSGIGRATAELAMSRGWRVGLFARRRAELEDVAAQGEAIVLPGDVTDRASVADAVAGMVETWGRVDVLFNNAGIFTPARPIDEISDDDWDRAVAVNLTGMFNMARAAFGQMRTQTPQGGRIINNGSISAHVPRPGSITYTATKHAVTGLTRTLSLDGRPFDIACGQIDIGNAETDMVRNLHDSLRAQGRAQDVQPVMDVGNAASSILHMADLPLDANIQFMTVMATKMPYIGRG